MNNSLLEFSDIKKSFGKSKVLLGISLGIENGDLVGLVGPSGSGKTTLMKILIGIMAPDSGAITFEGKNALKSLKYLRKNTGFATQENTLFDELSIKENSYYFGKLYGLNKNQIKENFYFLLGLLSLQGFENKQIKHLSGGMAKRANLLVSLIHKPKLLILDEPTAGLDILLRKNLWEYIHEINRTGTTILVTSHLLEELEENCSNIAILNKGKIVDAGTITELRNEHRCRDLNEIFKEAVS